MRSRYGDLASVSNDDILNTKMAKLNVHKEHIAHWNVNLESVTLESDGVNLISNGPDIAIFDSSSCDILVPNNAYQALEALLTT